MTTLSIFSYSCRFCKEVWVLATDGSFEKVIRKPENVCRVLRDAHEKNCHEEVAWTTKLGR